MIKDIVIETVGGRIVFSCPHCMVAEIDPETIRSSTVAITAVKCPRCSNLVTINKSKIDAAIDRLVNENPLIENPLPQKPSAPPQESTPPPPPPAPAQSAGTAMRPAQEPKPTGTPAPGIGHPIMAEHVPEAHRDRPSPTEGLEPPESRTPRIGHPVLADRPPGGMTGVEPFTEKLPADYVIMRVHGVSGTPMPSSVGLTDLILVVDLEDSFRDDIWIIFSDIARVEGYRGAKGAADYIRTRADEITIMMMELNLGDGTCLEVLDAIGRDGRAGAIPTIVTYVDTDRYEAARHDLANHPQVKICIKRDDLVKKMIELSLKIVRKED